MRLLSKIFIISIRFLLFPTCLALGYNVPSFGDDPRAKEVIQRSENEYKKIKYLQFKSEDTSQGFSGKTAVPYYSQKTSSTVKLDFEKEFSYWLIPYSGLILFESAKILKIAEIGLFM